MSISLIPINKSLGTVCNVTSKYAMASGTTVVPETVDDFRNTSLNRKFKVAGDTLEGNVASITHMSFQRPYILRPFITVVAFNIVSFKELT
jgi:hypothetical protein